MARILREPDDGSFDRIRIFLLLERLDEQQINIIKSLTPRRFDLEFGLQTLSPVAAKAIRRRCFSVKVIEKRLAPPAERQHVSVDYIYPLPGEGPDEVRKNVERLLAIPGLQVRLNQLLLPAGCEFGNDPARWGFSVEDVDGYPFAVASDHYSPRDVEEMEAWVEGMRDRYGGRLEPTTRKNWVEHRGGSEQMAFFSFEQPAAQSPDKAFLNDLQRALGDVLGGASDLEITRFDDRIEVRLRGSPDTKVIVTKFVKGRHYYACTEEIGVYYVGDLTKEIDALASKIIREVRVAS